MILIGLGANLPNPRFGAPKATLAAALEELDGRGVRVTARSRWYTSAPVPASDQPDYVNAVVAVESALGPEELLAMLLDIEGRFGRRRSVPNAARIIDLDLLAYDDLVRESPEFPPVLPHPRMAGRAFVLRPLCDIAPDWRHPVTGATAAELARAVAGDEVTEIAGNSPD